MDEIDRSPLIYSSRPIGAEPRAGVNLLCFSCFTARTFLFSALILKASDDCFYSRHYWNITYYYFFLFFLNKKIHKDKEVKLLVQIPSNLIEISVFTALIGPSRLRGPNEETYLRLHDNFIIIRHDFYITRVRGR